MLRIVPIFTIISILLFSIWFLGCTNDSQNHSEIYVFAAMSLTDALTEIGDQFTEENRNKVYYNFAASSTLQRQIEKGASTDIFISASSKQVDNLQTLDLLEDGSRFDILGNNLVIVSEKNDEIPFETVTELLNPSISRIAIGHPEIVPAGTYAKEALIHFNLWEKLQPKLIFGTDVRVTLAYVTAGNVDLAIVYETDTIVSNDVKVVYRFPAEIHTPIAYPAVILKSSRQKQNAHKFIKYLKTRRATDIFEKHGFTCLSFKDAQLRMSDTSQ